MRKAEKITLLIQAHQITDFALPSELRAHQYYCSQCFPIDYKIRLKTFKSRKKMANQLFLSPLSLPFQEELSPGHPSLFFFFLKEGPWRKFLNCTSNKIAIIFLWYPEKLLHSTLQRSKQQEADHKESLKNQILSYQLSLIANISFLRCIWLGGRGQESQLFSW